MPFTRLVGGGSGAVPVVDLGTAGRGRALGGGWDRGLDPESRGDVLWAKWDYIRDRYGFPFFPFRGSRTS